MKVKRLMIVGEIFREILPIVNWKDVIDPHLSTVTQSKNNMKKKIGNIPRLVFDVETLRFLEKSHCREFPEIGQNMTGHDSNRKTFTQFLT
jgi:hypothetical protein